MKIFLTFLVCLIVPGSIFAQVADVDHRAAINNAKNDTAKALAYKNAIFHYTHRNTDSLNYFSEAGLAEFRKKNFKTGEGIILAQLGILDRSEGRTNLASQRLKTALELFRSDNYKRGIADVLGNIGSIEAGKGHVEAAVKYITESMKLEESLDNKSGVMIGYMNLGSMSLERNELDQAEKYLNKAAAISKQIPLSNQVVGLFNMMGVMYAYKGEQEKALKCFQDNLELCTGNSFVASYVECLSYLGQYWLENGDVDKSIRYLKEGLAVARERNMAEMQSNLLLTLGGIVFDKDAEKGLAYVDTALLIATNMENKAFMATIYKGQADLYKSLNRFKEALIATEKSQKIKDSIFSINKSIELSSITANFELEKSTLKVQDLELKNKAHSIQRNILLVIAICVVLLLLIFIFFYRKLFLLNQQLRNHQKELKELNMMKDKLFSIIGHDLRGPVARIPAILEICEDKSTTEEEKSFLFNNLREHTKSTIEMLDKLLFWGQSLVKGIRMQGQVVNIKKTISDNITLRRLLLAEKNLSIIDNTPENTSLNIDITHFDFVVRNLLANAIKYSYTGGTITINADSKRKPGYTVISVTDTGIGISKELLPEIFNPANSLPGTADEKGTGIGLMLCKEFVLLNGGEIWAESTPGSGATFFVAFRNAR